MRTGRNETHGARVEYALLVILGLVTLAGQPVMADEIFWDEPLGGVFNVAANWSPLTVPGASDTAIFDLGETTAYTVLFPASANITNSVCLVRNDAVDMDLEGSTYTLSLAGRALVVSEGTGQIGSLWLTDGTLEAETIDIGLWEGANGLLDVGAGMTVTLADSLGVANDGDGSVVIHDGAAVTAFRSILGGHALGNQGSLEVYGTDSSLTLTDHIIVGHEGAATALVRDGGSVGTVHGTIGNGAAGDGTMTVRGADASFDVSNSLNVGLYGHGEFTIEQAGSASVELIARVAWFEGSTGELTVTDANSSFLLNGSLIVGDSGQGHADVLSGGSIEVPEVYVGLNATGEGTLNVDDASELVVSSNMRVGQGGTGNATISNGSVVSASGAGLVVGNQAAGTMIVSGGSSVQTEVVDLGVGATGDGSLTITGASSTLDVGNAISLGHNGMAELTIADGGAVDVLNTIRVGWFEPSTGELTVRDAGSLVTTDNIVYVGDGGHGSANVLKGGTLDAREINVGSSATSDGTLNVSGASSQLVVDELMRIGYFGPGAATFSNGASLSAIGAALGVGDQAVGTLTVSGGSTVQVENVDLGYSTPGDGDVTITGADSTLDVGNTLNVGLSGTAALTIADGGSVDAPNTIRIGWFDTSTGEVTVTDAGSSLTTDNSLSVGDGGNGTLSILNGGAARADQMFVGLAETASGDISVAGSGSQLEATTQIEIGYQGSGTLAVSAGGAIDANQIIVGGYPTGIGEFSVSDADSVATIDDTLTIGWDGQGTCTIANGASVATAGMRVGNQGDGSLTIQQQATATAQWIEVGVADSGDGEVTVDGPGSTLTATEGARIGYWGTGSVQVTGGATVSTSDYSGWIIVGDIADSDGTVTVDGGSLLSADHAPIIVGNSGQGALSVLGGSQAYSEGELFAGSQAGASAIVTVDGAGSRYESDSVYPSKLGDGGSAALNIANGGQFELNSACFVGLQAGSSGTIALSGSGSTFEATTLLVGRAGAANVTIGDGRVALGVDPATVPAGELHLGAGAQLGGTGTIVGSVINSQGGVFPGGTINDDIVIGILHVQGDYEQQVDGMLEVELGGTTSGDGYCVLNVTGSAVLDGELVITAVNGFTPQPGDVFEIVSAGAVSGEFSSVTADDRYCVSYTPVSVLIALAGFGDITLDCAVDMDDFAYFEDCAAGPNMSPTPTLPGVTVQDCLDAFDGDADGDVDQSDFLRFQAAFTGSNG